MDWRFNTIWFEQLEQGKLFEKDFKDRSLDFANKDFQNSEYAIIWHLKEKANAFDNLRESENLLYLDLHWANLKNFYGIEKYRNLKRLELHCCIKLEEDKGISQLANSLEYLHINFSAVILLYWSIF